MYHSPWLLLVPVTGLEPVRHRWRRILSPLRLPFHHTGRCEGIIHHLFQNSKHKNTHNAGFPCRNGHLASQYRLCNFFIGGRGRPLAEDPGFHRPDIPHVPITQFLQQCHAGHIFRLREADEIPLRVSPVEQPDQRRQRLKGIPLSVVSVGKCVAQADGAVLGHDHDLAHQLIGVFQRNRHHARPIHRQCITAAACNQFCNTCIILRLPPLIPGADVVIAVVVDNRHIFLRHISQNQPLSFQKSHEIRTTLSFCIRPN